MSVTRHQAVGAYQRWEPPSFDEGLDTPDGLHSSNVSADQASPALKNEDEPTSPLPHLPEDPPIKLPTAEEIEAMFEQAREEGLAVGFEAGRAAAHAEAERLSSLVGRMDEALDRIDQDIAEEVVGLAIAIAKQMIRHTLADHPASVAETVREALQQLPQNQVRIHVHPDDAALIREYLADQLEHGHHRIAEDDTVTRGGCRLEAAGCEIDATVETRWRRILEGIGRTDASWEDSDA